MSQHTPGPWTVWKGHSDVYAGVAQNTREGLIGYKGKPMPMIAVCGDECDLTESEINANAQLIATAPILLAECKWVADWLESFSMPPTSTIEEKQLALARLRAAIAKAEKGE